MRFLHSYSSSSFKDIMQHNSNSATLASEVMVFSDSISPCRLPKETSVSSGLCILKSGQTLHSNLAMLHPHAWRFRGRQLSATQCIAQSRTLSRSPLPDGRLFFSDWCQEMEFDPLNPSLKELVHFVCYRFETFKLSVSCIKGYRSAISNTLRFSDCTSDPIITDLFKGFYLQRPVSRSLTPKWNLTCVLWSLTKPPHGPLKSASIKHLALKTHLLSLLCIG